MIANVDVLLAFFTFLGFDIMPFSLSVSLSCPYKAERGFFSGLHVVSIPRDTVRVAMIYFSSRSSPLSSRARKKYCKFYKGPYAL